MLGLKDRRLLAVSGFCSHLSTFMVRSEDVEKAVQVSQVDALHSVILETLHTHISKCIATKQQYQIIRLKTTREGIEKGSHKSIKEYYAFLSVYMRRFGTDVLRIVAFRAS